MQITQLVKSKTVWLNIILGAVVGFGSVFGIEPDAESIGTFAAMANIILRLMTTNSISDK